jgi:hypothetical protein
VMDYIKLDSVSEYEMDFVRRLRFSKCLDTLDRQCELLEASHKGQFKALAAINVAWCIREQELLRIGAPVFKTGKVRMSV